MCNVEFEMPRDILSSGKHVMYILSEHMRSFNSLMFMLPQHNLVQSRPSSSIFKPSRSPMTEVA